MWHTGGHLTERGWPSSSWMTVWCPTWPYLVSPAWRTPKESNTRTPRSEDTWCLNHCPCFQANGSNNIHLTRSLVCFNFQECDDKTSHYFMCTTSSNILTQIFALTVQSGGSKHTQIASAPASFAPSASAWCRCCGHLRPVWKMPAVHWVSLLRLSPPGHQRASAAGLTANRAHPWPPSSTPPSWSGIPWWQALMMMISCWWALRQSLARLALGPFKHFKSF